MPVIHWARRCAFYASKNFEVKLGFELTVNVLMVLVSLEPIQQENLCLTAPVI